MKGRRKIKELKWILRTQIEAEAKSLMAKRSKKAKHRFLDAVTPFVINLEPTGRLAGAAQIATAGSSTQCEF